MPVTGEWNTPERVNYDAYNTRMADEANDYLTSLQVRYYHHGYGTVLNGNSEHCAEVVKEIQVTDGVDLWRGYRPEIGRGEGA